MKQHKNIKKLFDFPSIKLEVITQNKQILLALRSLGVGGIFAFIFLNLIFSQFVSPLYFKFVSNDKISTISFLQKIKTLPEYLRILEMNNIIYGDSVKTTIFSEENRKKDIINNLEQQLIINPKSRDVLYNLYKLYLGEGEIIKAEEYLRQAKEVDPNVK